MRVGFGLGSNLGDKPDNIREALRLIEARGVARLDGGLAHLSHAALGRSRSGRFRQRLRHRRDGACTL